MATSRFDLGALRSRDELTAVGKDIAAEIKSDDVPSLAAAVSFKIVLALFPSLLAAVAISALVTDPNDLTRLLDQLPDDFSQVTEIIEPRMRDFIDEAGKPGVAVAGIAVGLWAASGAAATLNKALSRAYDEADDRKLVSTRGIALVVTVALLVALIAISVLLVAGGAIEERILASLPLAESAQSALDVGSTVGRYVVAILLLMVLFAFIYWIGPDYEQRPRWAWITPGAALAVVTWLVASALFGWYVTTFGSYTDTDSPYGTLGSVIVFMLWLQLSMFALLLGAEVNQVLALRARRRHATGDSDAGSVGSDADGVPGGSSTQTAVTPAPGAAAAPTGVRAATSPTRGRDVTVTRAPTSPGAEGASATLPRRPGHAVVDHDGDTGRWDGGAAGAPGDDGLARRVPAATVVGAVVAAVSGLVGLTGLLRRLKG